MIEDFDPQDRPRYITHPPERVKVCAQDHDVYIASVLPEMLRMSRDNLRAASATESSACRSVKIGMLRKLADSANQRTRMTFRLLLAAHADNCLPHIESFVSSIAASLNLVSSCGGVVEIYDMWDVKGHRLYFVANIDQAIFLGAAVIPEGTECVICKCTATCLRYDGGGQLTLYCRHCYNAAFASEPIDLQILPREKLGPGCRIINNNFLSFKPNPQTNIGQFTILL